MWPSSSWVRVGYYVIQTWIHPPHCLCKPGDKKPPVTVPLRHIFPCPCCRWPDRWKTEMSPYWAQRSHGTNRHPKLCKAPKNESWSWGSWVACILALVSSFCVCVWWSNQTISADYVIRKDVQICDNMTSRWTKAEFLERWPGTAYKQLTYPCMIQHNLATLSKMSSFRLHHILFWYAPLNTEFPSHIKVKYIPNLRVKKVDVYTINKNGYSDDWIYKTWHQRPRRTGGAFKK